MLPASGLFDKDFYLNRNPDVARKGEDPLDHYLRHGWREGRDPNPLFDTRWYLENYPDVAKSGLNPLLHYVRYGTRLRRNPGPHFDASAYLDHHPDVARSGANPLSHYLRYGIGEGRSAPGVVGSFANGRPLLSKFEQWLAVNELSDRDVAELRDRLQAKAGALPRISIVTPVYNTDEALLKELADCVLGQVYESWEWCLVNDGSPSPHVRPMLERLADSDCRIGVVHREQNGGISSATNAAVAMASGDVIAFVDHDDLITRDCLAEVALYYADNACADIVYSDDDKIDLDGRRYAPQFKPDWSPVLLLSRAYLSHVITVRKALFEALGGFRSQFDGSQDYDFILRAAEVARHVGHIPKILYHWRAVAGSTASGGDAKPLSIERGRLALGEALKRRGLTGARAIHPDWASAANVGMFEIAFPDDGPSVCLIVPTKNQGDLLKTCIGSLKKTTYRNFEILVVDNDSDDEETLSYLEQLRALPAIRVVRIPSPVTGFNFAYLNNRAARETTADYLLFLNDDTKVIAADWLSKMVGYAQMKDVGVVGARLYFEDGSLQHAGIVHGYHEGLVGHAFRGCSPQDWGYLGFIRSAREYSGVTAACMLTKRALFEDLGGFDEEKFAVAYNDVDYCYRVVQSGRTCIYCPGAELWHYEGKTRGFVDNPEERQNFRQIYSSWQDRWYNPNLSLENERFEPEAVRPQTLRKDPVRTAVVSHNLNYEGAPIALLDVVIAMTEQKLIDPVVISPVDGPLRATYEAAGIRVIVLTGVFANVKDHAAQAVLVGSIGVLFRTLGVEVVLANTLRTYWSVLSANSEGIPSIWCQHESEPWETYFDYLPHDMRQAAYQAFNYPYRVLYVAEATRRLWRPLDKRGTFKIVRHGIPPSRLAQETRRWTKESARQELGIPADARVISVVGTVCRRKGQMDLANAYLKLEKRLQGNTFFFLAGNVAEQDYAGAIEEVVRDHNAGKFILTGEIDDPFLYYVASDVFACTSRVESAPRVIVEAMACGLPIVTTPVFGIPELVREHENSLFYEPGDSDALATALELLLSDDELRRKFADASPKVLAGQPSFAVMVEQYGRAVRQAVNLKTLAS